MSGRLKNNNLILEGRGPLVIRESDYKASGGEGVLYRANTTIIKLYHDPDKMKKEQMPEKLKLLSAIRHEYIVSPRGLVYDPAKKPLGFYMDYVEAEPLPRVFTNDFRQRENFGNEETKRLVERMRETVSFAHKNNALLVDANEMNWLAVLNGKGGPEPRIIDVDSWSLGKWPAKVIMPSIRDWHASSFSQLTDWFSWGIVTFQIFTGIHPYKGKLGGYNPSEMERRMKENASVFANGIRLPSAVRDFSQIPPALLSWYNAVFQHGERALPPSIFAAGPASAYPAKTLHVTAMPTGSLIFEKIFEKTNDPVIRIWPSGVCLLSSGKLYDLGRKREIGVATSGSSEVVKTPTGWIVADKAGSKYDFSFINGTSLKREALSLALEADGIVRYCERLFLIGARGITEIKFIDLGKPIISPGNTWGAKINSTKWFDGIGVEDAFGSKFIILPFGEDSCAHIRAPELDGLKIIDAKAGYRFAVISALNKKGEYKRIEFAFTREYNSYEATTTDADSAGINIAILPKGVVAEVIEDGELGISVPSARKINKVTDKYISTDMRLANWEDIVLYIQNGAVWKMKMK